MGTTITTETRAAKLTPSSAVSLGLVLLLLGAAVVYGRQSQQLDSLNSDMRELRTEVREIRTLLLRQQPTGR
jgi:hypothetical protein